jgi:peptide/nickel transport system substrate-binding protein
VRRPIRRLALAVVAAAVAASLVVAAGGAGRTTKSKVAAGGTYKVGWGQAFGFTDNMDPVGEYLAEGIGIHTNLLTRTLVGYKHLPGAAGNQIVADIATTVPKPTNGGKTYTFHIKPGVKFSPPVNRQVTSADFLNEFKRIATPKDGAQYSFYYSVIKGFTSGKGKTISGIQTPNPSTIVFNLTAPTGDFLYRLSMPAAGPQPNEVTKCFDGQAEKYGQDMVSTGPYMIQGIDKLDTSSCANVKPVSGYDGATGTHMILVRNPNYEQKTDQYRKNLPDEFDFLVDANSDDIFNKVSAGEFQDEVANPPSQVLRRYVQQHSSSLHQNSGDRTWYLTMNLTQAPFDDIHVRKAMNWIMDKHALVQAWGGPTIGQVANHIVPDTLFNNQLSEYKPYKTPGDRGSLSKAKAAMKGSKYDTSGNGTCSASACKNVYLLADTRPQDGKMIPVIQAAASKIGITFKVHTVNGAYPTLQTPSKNIPLGERPGWGKDYADPLTFFAPLFDGRTIIPNGNTNYSLVGITASQCKTLKVTGNCTNVPSVNKQLDKCSVLLGQPRLTCYENLDKTLMTTVVPWVPYLWSTATHITAPNVTSWQFDQFPGGTAYSQVAVK